MINEAPARDSAKEPIHGAFEKAVQTTADAKEAKIASALRHMDEASRYGQQADGDLLVTIEAKQAIRKLYLEILTLGHPVTAGVSLSPDSEGGAIFMATSPNLSRCLTVCIDDRGIRSAGKRFEGSNVTPFDPSGALATSLTWLRQLSGQ